MIRRWEFEVKFLNWGGGGRKMWGEKVEIWPKPA